MTLLRIWLLFSCCLWGQVPAGTVILARLDVAVSSSKSQSGDQVTARITAPVLQGNEIRLPAGSVIKGKVARAEKRSSKGYSVLALEFSQLVVEGKTFPIKAGVSGIDNVRESLLPDGTVRGMDKLSERPGKIELLLLLAAHAHPIALAALETTKLVIAKEEHPQVEFPAGTDFQIRLTAPLPPVIAKSAEFYSEVPGLLDIRNLPLRTETPGGVLSDLTNVVLAGELETVVQAFEGAGWTSADKLAVRSDVKVFFALAEKHAYRQAPVSTLLLEGRPPDLVFQKQTNTFAMRHHIRLWNVMRDGESLWVGSATHDIAIEFALQTKTFTHRVDLDIDQERWKVVTDLSFSGHVGSVALAGRANAPRTLLNGTGDSLKTDGQIAVLVLQ